MMPAGHRQLHREPAFELKCGRVQRGMRLTDVEVRVGGGTHGHQPDSAKISKVRPHLPAVNVDYRQAAAPEMIPGAFATKGI